MYFSITEKHNLQFYSFFKASAGFVRAAFKVCQSTDRKAITREMTTATTKIQL